ncbi:MAG: hypothetical protein O9289_21055 [Rhodobacteraceae bacterium]|nr:hypothetical protein [Paracoccaceae bacterium]MCZ8085670.1 hypothetical protein [Paracoccaceae bacterium]
MKLENFLYPAAMIAALLVDYYAFEIASENMLVVKSFLIQIFGSQSVYAQDYFAGATLRILITLPVAAVFLAPLMICRSKTFDFGQFFKPTIASIVVLAGLFIYLNSHSPNSDKLIYALISYMALILFLARENIIFFMQTAYTTSHYGVWLGALASLTAFVLLHPLVLSEGRILGTLLMVNLWIYTVTARNIWLGVAIHAAWNFGFPESAEFHYALFIVSCFLAYGQPTYPSALTVFGWVPRLIVRPWRMFWLTPATLVSKLRVY